MLSCSVLFPLHLSKCYIQFSYCRNSSVLSFQQKKVIEHTNTIRSTLVICWETFCLHRLILLYSQEYILHQSCWLTSSLVQSAYRDLENPTSSVNQQGKKVISGDQPAKFKCRFNYWKGHPFSYPTCLQHPTHMSHCQALGKPLHLFLS